MEVVLQLAQVISAGASVLALLLIWLQLRYQSRQVEFECLTSLHQELASGSMQQAIRFIYSVDQLVIQEPAVEADLEKIELVLNTFDLVGFRVKKGILPKKATLETEWMVLVPLWSRVRPFVERQRELRGNVPYKQHFEWLVREAQAYRERHYPDRLPRIFKWPFAALKSPQERSEHGDLPSEKTVEHLVESSPLAPKRTVDSAV